DELVVPLAAVDKVGATRGMYHEPLRPAAGPLIETATRAHDRLLQRSERDGGLGESHRSPLSIAHTAASLTARGDGPGGRRPVRWTTLTTPSAGSRQANPVTTVHPDPSHLTYWALA